MTTTTTKISARIDGKIESITCGDYNGISILIRDSDGYINATKLAAQQSETKRNNLGRYLKSAEMKEIIQYWKEFELPNRRLKSEATQDSPVFYELIKVSNEFRGIYVNPDLIHFVAEWIDIDYAFAVKHVMDKINEYSHAVNKSFDQAKDEIINQLQAKIEEQQIQINELEEHISNTSVPEETSYKDLYIIREGEKFKLCADSTHQPPNFIRHYIFPASMNIRKMIRNEFELRYNDIPNDCLEEVMTFIKQLNPKFTE